MVPEIDVMKNATNTRCEAAVKVGAFHVFIMISIFLIIAGIVGNLYFPGLNDSRVIVVKKPPSQDCGDYFWWSEDPSLCKACSDQPEVKVKKDRYIVNASIRNE